jgi:hypothetical protein
MRLSTLVLLGLLALLVCSNPAHAARSYDNCTGFITSVPTVISTPGTWCLKQDVTTAITSGDAITIASDNVVVDCNDFRLDGLAGGLATAAYGIHALNQNNLKTRHCNIRGFYRGLFFEGTGGRHVVEDNHFDQNVYNGLRVSGDGSVIRHNLITDTGGTPNSLYAYGISSYGSADIIDNTIVGLTTTSASSTSAIGILVDFDEGGSVIGNRVEGLLPLSPDGTEIPDGIQVFDATRMDIRHNQIIGSLARGIGLFCDTTNGGGPQVRARDSVISGFGLAISDCADAGENDITP